MPVCAGRRTICGLLAVVVVAVSAVPVLADSQFAAFLQAHCADCHAGAEAANAFDVGKLGDDFETPSAHAKWVRLHDRVATGEMPPKDHPQPTDTQRAAFLAPLKDALTAASAARAQTVMRRLNRVEYENTLNDLLGTAVSVAEMLPEDGKAGGFDNVGEALDLSPVQLQRYMEAAGKGLDAGVCRGPKPESKTTTVDMDTERNKGFIGRLWLKRPDGALVFFGDGTYPPIKPEYRTPVEGRYKIRIFAAAHQSDKPVTYGVYLGPDSFEKSSTLFDHYEADPGPITPREIEAYLWKGDTLRFIFRSPSNILYKLREVGAEKYEGAGLAIEKIEIEGPLVDEWPTRGHKLRFGELTTVDVGPENQRNKGYYKPTYEVVSQSPEADVERLLPAFTAAAFRRPVTADEVAPFVELAKAELAKGSRFEQALRHAHIAVLSSPEFLYLIEPPGRLDDYAIASRLSYLLWTSMPDEELLRHAAAGRLSSPDVLRAQTERMLADRRAERFTKNFVGQWLNLREIDFTTPDRQLYPEFDEPLKHAMQRETELFFDDVLSNNRSLLDFVDSDWTYLNQRLAQHYGIDGVEGTEMRKVALRPEDGRGGVLAHGAVLKVSANGTTTSPVVRGAYVLQRILGFDPPPPPPGVPGVEPDIRGAETLREQLAKHRSTESCNNCHKVIDPPGFALECFDVTGRYRTYYRSLGKQFKSPPRDETDGRSVQWRIGSPVDPSGTTAAGQTFANFADYKKLLLAEKQRIAEAMTVRLATYATGRVMGFSDRPAIDAVVAASAKTEYGFRELLHTIIHSDLFLQK
jgi:hypothetical protein